MMNKQRSIISPLLLMFPLLITSVGCQTNTAPNPGMLDPATPYYRVMVNDDALASALRFDEPVVVRDENGFISKVEITVRAASFEALHVDYRPIFKDKNGTILQPESSWRTRILEKRVPERIAMLPNAKNAADYEIQFRWSK